jgi:hypothetical protein
VDILWKAALNSPWCAIVLNCCENVVVVERMSVGR